MPAGVRKHSGLNVRGALTFSLNAKANAAIRGILAIQEAPWTQFTSSRAAPLSENFWPTVYTTTF